MIITIKELRDALKGLKGDMQIQICKPINEISFQGSPIDEILIDKENKIVRLWIQSNNEVGTTLINRIRNNGKSVQQ